MFFLAAKRTETLRLRHYRKVLEICLSKSSEDLFLMWHVIIVNRNHTEAMISIPWCERNTETVWCETVGVMWNLILKFENYYIYITETMLKLETINNATETILKLWTAQSSNKHFKKRNQDTNDLRLLEGVDKAEIIQKWALQTWHSWHQWSWTKPNTHRTTIIRKFWKIWWKTTSPIWIELFVNKTHILVDDRGLIKLTFLLPFLLLKFFSFTFLVPFFWNSQNAWFPKI